MKNMKKPQRLGDFLDKKLSKEEKKYLTASFDIVGEIAVIEIKPELRHKEKLIGEAILKMHKNVKTVCRRQGIHDGAYRIQKLKIIAGKRTKETIHRESSCRLKLNVEKCYFSVRSGTERLRIADMINKRFSKTKKKEDIMVMFSGVGPFVCVIGKHCKYNKLIGIEMNPVAHEYAEENIVLNKIKAVELIKGDVKKAIPKLIKNGKIRYDRILMPLPRIADEFLEYALMIARRGTVIHLYGFLGEDEFSYYKKKVRKICKDNGFRIKINDLVKCGQFSPRIFRICIDFQVK